MMNNTPTNLEFERSKIYEKLDYTPQPVGYTGNLPWTIQQQIASTNGIQYADRVGKMQEYPVYELPVKKVENGLMLDIGCGWGRWLVSGIRKGYIPVGIDVRIEFCETALETLRNNKTAGYVVAADLKELPFKDNSFDFIWSFSVIQHTHKDRLIHCLEHIHRTLKNGGFTKLEFPNKNGFRNKRGPVKEVEAVADDYDSWEARYYTIEEYQKFFASVFNNVSYTVHSFLGIGVLKEDLKYVSFKNKILCGISLGCTAVTKILTPLKKIADSLYFQAYKQTNELGNIAINNFLKAHAAQPGNNLNIIHLLQCPISGTSLLQVEGDNDFLYNEAGTVKYPLINNIPIIIRSEAKAIHE